MNDMQVSTSVIIRRYSLKKAVLLLTEALVELKKINSPLVEKIEKFVEGK